MSVKMYYWNNLNFRVNVFFSVDPFRLTYIILFTFIFKRPLTFILKLYGKVR